MPLHYTYRTNIDAELIQQKYLTTLSVYFEKKHKIQVPGSTCDY